MLKSVKIEPIRKKTFSKRNTVILIYSKAYSKFHVCHSASVYYCPCSNPIKCKEGNQIKISEQELFIPYIWQKVMIYSAFF